MRVTEQNGITGMIMRALGPIAAIGVAVGFLVLIFPSAAQVVNGDSTTTTAAITMVSPQTGLMYSGAVDFKASAVGPLSDIRFVLTDPLGLPVEFVALDKGSGRFEYRWDPTAAIDGPYVVHARGKTSTGSDISSMSVTFSRLTGTTDANSGGSSSSGNNNGSSGESDTTSSVITEPISISIEAPGAADTVISGTSLLRATTTGPVGSVEFFIGGTTSATVPGVPGTASLGTWSASWDSSSVPDGSYSVTVKARSSDGARQVQSISRSIAVSNVASAPSKPSLMITLNAPADGVTLGASTAALVESNEPLESLIFTIVRVADQSTVSLAGTPYDGSFKKWSVPLDPSTLLAGDHRITAEGRSGSRTASTAPRTIRVPASSTTDATVPAPDPATGSDTTSGNDTVIPVIMASLIQPVSGDVTGSVRLVAATSGTVDSVRFFIRRLGDAVSTFEVAGQKGSSAGQWSATWDAQYSPEAKYSIIAVARGGASEVQSGEAIVSLKRPSTTASNTTTSPIAAAIEIVRPYSGSVKGMVTLVAKASGLGDVQFTIRDVAGGVTVLTRKAVFDAALQAWTSFWDATGILGEFSVVASGSSNGTKRDSVPVIVSVEDSSMPSATTDVAPEVIPQDVVKETIFETRVEVRPLEREELPEGVESAERELDKDCAVAAVPEDRCAAWLARRYQDPSCREAGIITKEECVAFLQERNGGTVPGCTDQASCDAEIARKTAGLLYGDELAEIDGTVVPRIGTVVRFQRAVTSPEEGFSANVEKLIPIRAEREPAALRIHASPAFADIDDSTTRRAVPAVLIVDTDEDGLPDDMELRFGTDPKAEDTDGDGFTDADEIRNGYDPRGLGQLTDVRTLAPIDIAVIAGVPLEQPVNAGEVSDSLKVDTVALIGSGSDPQDPAAVGVIELRGRGIPGETVTIFVYSYLPVVFTADVDENGDWTYDLQDDLIDGRHEVYVTVTDETGKITKKSDPLAFLVASAQAVSPEDFYGEEGASSIAEREAGEFVSAAEATADHTRWFVLGAAALLVLAGVLAFLVMRPQDPEITA